MAPKKSTRVYALAAATVITAGTLSYVPATLHLKQVVRPVQIPPLLNRRMRIPHCRFRLSLGQTPTHLLNRQVLRKRFCGLYTGA